MFELFPLFIPLNTYLIWLYLDRIIIITTITIITITIIVIPREQLSIALLGDSEGEIGAIAIPSLKYYMKVMHPI